jgi:transaldolase
MELFIDSAILKDIEQFFSWGIGEGITTNPSLMKKAVDAGAAENLKSYIIQILKAAKNTPVSLEVTETTAKGMIKQGRNIYKLFKPYGNVYVKIPVNPAFEPSDKNHLDGIKAIKKLVKDGIPINCTLIFTPEQAHLAAKAGASFVSPFAGRVDDYLRTNAGVKFEKTDYYPAQGALVKGKLAHDDGIVSGMHLVKACVDVMGKYKLKTKVLAASLRNPLQIAEAEAVKSDIATIPFDAIVAMRENPALIPVLNFPKLKREKKSVEKMLQHPKTFEGMKTFTGDIVDDYVELTK